MLLELGTCRPILQSHIYYLHHFELPCTANAILRMLTYLKHTKGGSHCRHNCQVSVQELQHTNITALCVSVCVLGNRGMENGGGYMYVFTA